MVIAFTLLLNSLKIRVFDLIFSQHLIFELGTLIKYFTTVLHSISYSCSITFFLNPIQLFILFYIYIILFIKNYLKNSQSYMLYR